MLREPFQDTLILTGPTGSGKTQLALELALQINAEIIAMDSMTLYRGMDIGTAKPTPLERQRVGHHLLDVLDPWDSASVAWWLEQAEACCRDIEQRGKRALLVGGTPLYLKAVLHGLFHGPPADAQIRMRLAEVAARRGTHSLHERLNKVDPITANRVHPNDIRRTIRALEVWELTGRPISSWQQQWAVKAQAVDEAYQVLCLDHPRDELFARIDARVDNMFATGLIDEARHLRSLPQPIGKEACQALGYKEVFAYLDGLVSLQDTIELVKLRSRQLAKRQLTWFRHLSPCRLVTKELTFTLWGLTIGK